MISLKFALLLMAGCAVNVHSSDVSLFPELPLVAPASSDATCRDDSVKFEKNLQNLTIWAYQMWDSSAKRPSGLIHGLTHVFGDFDECLAVNGPVKTKYCLATLSVDVPKPNHEENVWENPNLPLTDVLYYTGDLAKYRRDVLRWALCVPQSCSTSDLSVEINKTLIATPVPNITYNFQLKSDDCQVDRTNDPYTNGEIAFLVVTALLLGCMFFCTGADLCQNGALRKKKTEKFHEKFVSYFSARENIHLWLTKEKNDATALFHAARVIFMLILIFGHRYVTFGMGPMSNSYNLEKISRSLSYMMVARGDLLVDTFLALSGLLTTYTCLVVPEKKQLNFIRSVALRYLRLTPVYAYVILFMATMFYKSGQGPLWHEYAGFERDNCQENWWVNLLHLNNYVNLSNWCMLQSFYIPLEVHLFILSFPFNLLLKKKPKLGLWLLGIGVVISIIIPFTLTIIYDMPAAILMFTNYLSRFRETEMVTKIYIKTHNRFGAYLMGMMAGYYYYKLKDSNRFIPWPKTYALILFGAVVNISIMLMGYPFFQLETTPIIYRALYSSTQRLIWCFGNICIAIAIGYGEIAIVPAIFRWGFWAPLARLTYGMYLTNMAFQMWDVASLRHPYHYSLSTWIFQTIYDFVMSTIFALILYLTIETPISRLAKELITPKVPPAPAKAVEDKINGLPQNGTAKNSINVTITRI